MQTKVSAEIDRYFKFDLGRPELLNRIGENIIVFDFIRRDVAEQIYSMMVELILARVQQASGCQVELSDAVLDQLRELCLSDLSDGGRGIRNQLEAHLVNPLARLLFDEAQEGALMIESMTAQLGLTVLHPLRPMES